MDRGYDDNKMFLKLDDLNQHYVIRLKSNRKLFYHRKWTTATELCSRRKGKIKTDVFYKGKDRHAYLSHVKVQITASKKDIYLVLVYGITEHPMMLATNLLLLPISKRHLGHTFLCQRGRQALVPDKASGIPSTLPSAGRLNR